MNQNKACVSSFTLKLDDCLACSGCVQDFIKNDIPIIETLKTNNLSFIISPHSKLSIFNHYTNLKPCKYSKFEINLVNFLRSTFKIQEIIDTSYTQNTLNKAVYDDLNDNSLIISDCPGTVMYIEKQAPHLIKYLSCIPTQQQVCLDMCKKKGTMIISVVQCYDKKFEVDSLIMTTYEFYKLIIDTGFLEYESDIEIKEMEKTCSVGLYFGYLNYILQMKYFDTKLNIYNKEEKKTEFLNKIKKTCEISPNGKRHRQTDNFIRLDTPYKYNVKNNNTFTYEFTKDKNSEIYCRIVGLEGLLNLIKETKILGMKYKVCEIYICSGGCLNGPGQIYVEDYSQLINQTFSNSEKILDIEMVRRKFRYKKVNFNVEW